MLLRRIAKSTILVGSVIACAPVAASEGEAQCQQATSEKSQAQANRNDQSALPRIKVEATPARKPVRVRLRRVLM